MLPYSWQQASLTCKPFAGEAVPVSSQVRSMWEGGPWCGPQEAARVQFELPFAGEAVPVSSQVRSMWEGGPWCGPQEAARVQFELPFAGEAVPVSSQVRSMWEGGPWCGPQEAARVQFELEQQKKVAEEVQGVELLSLVLFKKLSPCPDYYWAHRLHKKLVCHD
jgi:hypothetical protein